MQINFWFSWFCQVHAVSIVQACLLHDRSYSEVHDLCLAGMLRIDGIMEGKARMFDTPGVPHDHQLSSRLSPDEVPSLPPSLAAE